MYDKGHGVRQNDTEAVLWYKKADARRDTTVKSLLLKLGYKDE